MTPPATHRVTVDGLEMDIDDNGEIVRVWSEPAPSIGASFTEGEPLSSAELAALDIARAEVVSRDDVAALSEAMAQQGLGPMAQHAFSECEPTYALSHRFGWPDANGVMRCACGSEMRHRSEQIACSIHSVFWPWPYAGVATQLSWTVYLEELYGPVVWRSEWRESDPVEAERQRCERLGVEWVGPDVQAMPNQAALLAAGMTPAIVEAECWIYARRFRVEGYWSTVEDEWRYREIEEARHSRIERDDIAEAEHWWRQEHQLKPYRFQQNGNIVRLGCELREADGVTPG